MPVLFGNRRRKRSANENSEDENEEMEPVVHQYDTKYRQVIPDGIDTPMNFQILSRRKRAAPMDPLKWQYGSNITVALTMIPGNTPIKIWLRVLNTLYASDRRYAIVNLIGFTC